MSAAPATVIESLYAAAARNPAAAAVIHRDQCHRYAALVAMVERAAGQFQAQGIGAGQRVGLSMAGRLLHLVALYALARIGACAIPLQPRLAASVRGTLVEKLGIESVIVEAAGMAEGLARELCLDRIEIGPMYPGLAADWPWPRADDLACALLTSGTTGIPKATPYTHRELLQRMQASLPDCGPRTRLLAPDLHLSVGHTYPQQVLAGGGTVVFARGNGMADVVEAITLHAVTHAMFSPLAARECVAALPPQGIGLPSLDQLRLVGGSPDPALREQLQRRASPRLVLTYGLTEVGVVSVITPERPATQARSVGWPCAGVEIAVIDDAGLAVRAGQWGQVHVRVAGMPGRYLADDALTQARYGAQGFATGDLGCLTPAGELLIEGRVDELLNLGGHKLSPPLAEAVLLSHPAVQEAAVLLLERADGRPELVAAVVLAPDRTELPPDLPGQARAHLGFLAPERYLRVAALPRNASGKLLRGELPGLLRGQSHEGGGLR